MQLRLPNANIVNVRRIVSAALGAALVGSLALASPASAAPKAPTGVQRDRVISRAHAWTKKRVPYSQTRYKGGYRTDCSGFVSMAWDIPENLVTWNIPLVAKRIGKSTLRPGDVLLNDKGGAGGRHVVLFEKWANKAHTKYWALEQNGQTDDAVRRVVPYPYRMDKNLYKPYRYTGMDGFYKEFGKSGGQPVQGWAKRKGAEAAVRAKALAKAKAKADKAAAKAQADEKAKSAKAANRVEAAVAAGLTQGGVAAPAAADLKRVIRRRLAPAGQAADESVPEGALVVTMLRQLGM